jgi:hypothetical protein
MSPLEYLQTPLAMFGEYLTKCTAMTHYLQQVRQNLGTESIVDTLLAR